MDFTKRSGHGLSKAIVPFSPITNSLYASRFLAISDLTSLTIPEFIPPHKPLSDVSGTRRDFFEIIVVYFFCR